VRTKFYTFFFSFLYISYKDFLFQNYFCICKETVQSIIVIMSKYVNYVINNNLLIFAVGVALLPSSFDL